MELIFTPNILIWLLSMKKKFQDFSYTLDLLSVDLKIADRQKSWGKKFQNLKPSFLELFDVIEIHTNNVR